MQYEQLFVKALGTTIAVESAALFLLARWKYFFPGASRPNAGRLAFAGCICSFATLPYLWFVLPGWISDYNRLTTVGEVSVTLVEGLLLSQLLGLRIGKAMLLSLLCNSASFAYGLLWLR